MASSPASRAVPRRAGAYSVNCHPQAAITYGFMASKALFAALEFDLFTHIAGGAGSFPELAKATGIAENRLVTLLTALKSLGLIA